MLANVISQHVLSRETILNFSRQEARSEKPLINIARLRSRQGVLVLGSGQKPSVFVTSRQSGSARPVRLRNGGDRRFPRFLPRRYTFGAFQTFGRNEDGERSPSRSRIGYRIVGTYPLRFRIGLAGPHGHRGKRHSYTQTFAFDHRSDLWNSRNKGATPTHGQREL